MKKQELEAEMGQNQDELLTSALMDNLILSPEERIEAHQAALELAHDLTLAGETFRAKSR